MKTARIPTIKSAGVWIDHRKAQIVSLAAGGATTQIILSNVEKHSERGGDSPMKGAYEARQVPADDRRQRALTGELNLYYDAVIAALQGYGKLLVFGPGEAKSELHSRLMKHDQAGPGCGRRDRRQDDRSPDRREGTGAFWSRCSSLVNAEPRMPSRHEYRPSATYAIKVS